VNENISEGFAVLAEDLKIIGEKITDQRTEKKALEAGAKPIVDRAKSVAGTFRRTGRLIQSIGAQYSEKSNTMRIGIGEPISTTNSSTGFYGRFHDQGWHPVGGKRDGKGRIKKGTKRRTGNFIQNPIFEPAYQAENERVYRNMIDVYRKEIN
jgi:hypothetical protein